MFSARKSKAAPPRQSVAPQVETSTTGSSRQIERSTTGSSLDDSNESSRRGDVALCCAYVLQGSDWAPVNNSRPDDLSGESRFLAAKIVQDEDMAEAFLELHDLPSVPDQGLVKKFGPHRPSDGDSPQQKGGSDEVSLSFKGEQFQGFSVFASPAPPVRRKSSKDLK